MRGGRLIAVLPDEVCLQDTIPVETPIPALRAGCYETSRWDEKTSHSPIFPLVDATSIEYEIAVKAST